MRIRSIATTTAALLAFTAAPADAMRCRNKLVNEGDPMAKVADLCGKPTQTSTRRILRSGFPRQNLDADSSRDRTATERELVVHNYSYVEIEVEVWLYNQGSSRLMREIVFLDNRVVEINTLGRGY